MLKALPLIVALLPAAAFAQLEQLENPGTVSAVQQRPYRMQHEFNLAVGVLPLDAFYKGLYAQVGYTYHWTDTFAWQVGRGAYSYAARTGLREELERVYNVLPTAVDEVQYFIGSDLMWKPFYGKMAVLNRVVWHGEAYLVLGATIFKFTNAFRPAVNLGAGLRLFVSRYASFRLEFTDNIVLPTGGGNVSIMQVATVSFLLGVNLGATE